MTERPILFSPPMVRAVLDGRKTQTRRPVKPQPISTGYEPLISYNHGVPEISFGPDDRTERGLRWWRLPYGEPGDTLWGREAWRTEARYDALKPTLLPRDALVSFDADHDREPNDGCRGKTRVSIHMPRWVSRIGLRVTAVRVERLNAITEADALAEGVVWSDRWQAFVVPGVEHPNKDFPVLSRATAREMYAPLWDTINGSGEWLGNPWVWVVSFERAR